MVDKTAIQYDLIFNTEAAQKDLASLVVQLKTANDAFSKSGSASAKAATDIKRSFGSVGSGIQNASYQIADFAVQVQGGAGVTRALSQQLPQLLAGFGAFGAVAGAAVAILGPLISNMGQMVDQTKAVDEAMKALSSANEAAAVPLDKLTESYGALAPAIAAVNTRLAEQLKLQAAQELSAFGKAAQDASGGVGILDSALAVGSGYLDTWTARFSELQGYISYTQGYTEYARQLDAIQSQYKLNTEQLGIYGDRINSINSKLASQDFGLAVREFARLDEEIKKNGDTAIYTSAGYESLRKAILAAAEIAPAASMGFSFTPRTAANTFSNYEGEAVVADQLATIQKRLADAKKAVADSAREAAAAQRAEENSYKSFVAEIERGVTPLQRAKDQLAKLKEEFAKFGDRLSPEQLQQYGATVEDLNEKIDKLTFKDRWETMAEGIQTLKTPLSELYDSLAQIGEAVTENLATGMTDAIMSLVEGTKSAKDAFKEFAVSFLKEITKMILKATILYMIQSALGMAGGGGGIGRFLSGVVGGGGLRSGGGLGRSANITTSENTLSTRSIPALRAAGTESSGVSIAPALNVQVINNSNSSVSTGRDPMGNIRIMINDEVANALRRGGNPIDRALQMGYGLRRNGK